jgi:hypothetical protein
MTLKRVWTPSGSYSSGSKKRLIVIHTMEGFTGANGAKDCAVYFQGNVGASSQVCIDNNRGTIWEGVSRANGAWTQCNFNSVSVSAEQSGYASWSHDYWMSNRSNQLHNMADYIAEEAKALGIPIILLSDSQAQGGSAGVTFHSRLGSTGCGHSDPGSGFPINEVLEWAKGGGDSVAPSGGGVFVSSAVFDKRGDLHCAGVWTDGKVNYNPPGSNTPWVAVDPDSNAKGGADIAYNAATDRILISYTNQGGKFCTYEKQATSGGTWGWTDRGGSFR